MNPFSSWFGDVPDDPFYQPRKPLWLPPEMSSPPVLPPPLLPRRPKPRTALLITPFYSKSPHGSFGKHVLTPTLALTSVAGTTPSHWQVRYWDENLLQGLPPTGDANGNAKFSSAVRAAISGQCMKHYFGHLIWKFSS